MKSSAEVAEAGFLLIGDEVFRGRLIGAPLEAKTASQQEKSVWGEVVFNTSMTGYQEILTDPSYAGQIVVFTAAHIGNTGANFEDLESRKIYASSVVIGSYTEVPSNFRSKTSLSKFLADQGIAGLVQVDTRALTLFLRDRGVVPGVVLPASEEANLGRWIQFLKTQSYGAKDWIQEVTTREPYRFESPSTPAVKAQKNVVVYDYGVKRQLLVDLARRGCALTVVPADYPAEKVLALKPDGVFLSNGPGDPKLATYAVKNVQALLGKVPLFGVCMGHQVLGIALGGSTYKLKFGHRGGNQPVQNLKTGAVEISSHNHGYAVDPKTLPSSAQLTHQNLNDGCCEGLAAPTLKAFSVQYHPESSPGPHDSGYLFDQFVSML